MATIGSETPALNEGYQKPSLWEQIKADLKSTQNSVAELFNSLKTFFNFPFGQKTPERLLRMDIQSIHHKPTAAANAHYYGQQETLDSDASLKLSPEGTQ